MTRRALLVAVLASAAVGVLARAQTPAAPVALDAARALDDVVAHASVYVHDYVARSSLLVAEERYVQEIRWPDNNPVAGNLSRTHPTAPAAESHEQVVRAQADSTRHNVGSVTRSMNIPTLALMFLHPDIRTRFTFTHEGGETVAGRAVWAIEYHERERPTLIKTTRGRDLAVTGKLWVEPTIGIVVKTAMIAADPLVRAIVTTTYRDDATLQFWVPGQMDEHYVAGSDADELTGSATYSNFRRSTVNTDDALRKPPLA